LTEIAYLVQKFPDEMSPRALFEEAPLCHCDDLVRVWLPQAIHSVWMEKFQIAKLLSDTEIAIRDTRQAHEDFFDELGVPPGQLRFPAVLRPLVTFQQQFSILSAAISRFPDRILPP